MTVVGFGGAWPKNGPNLIFDGGTMSAVEIVDDVLRDALDYDEDSEGGTHAYIEYGTAQRIVGALIAAGYICHGDLDVGGICPRCGYVRVNIDPLPRG